MTAVRRIACGRMRSTVAHGVQQRLKSGLNPSSFLPTELARELAGSDSRCAGVERAQRRAFAAIRLRRPRRVEGLAYQAKRPLNLGAEINLWGATGTEPAEARA